MDSDPNGGPSLGFFFPEIITFVGVVIMTPVWATRLSHQGYYGRALFLGAAVMIAGIAFVSLLVEERRWSAWLTMIALLILLFGLHSFLPAPGMFGGARLRLTGAA